MLLTDFDYELPEELIAQTPIEPRNASRLMVLDKVNETIEHSHFYDLQKYLKAGDVLVLNDTRVIPARLIGHRESGGQVEIFLLRRIDGDKWETLAKPGKKAAISNVINFGKKLSCKIVDKTDFGGRIVEFEYEGIFEEILDKLGETPLPPYIHEKLANSERYQTVYNRERGSAAAPTAGLHLTKEQMSQLQQAGIKFGYVTLHVGLGTFRPVKVDKIEDHEMHEEYYSIPAETVELINQAKKSGSEVIAVGTTTTRALESAAVTGELKAQSGMTNIFIYPGYQFKVIDGMITNFHLPKSTLIMMISAFAGRDFIMRAYREAVQNKYRFFSFGDAMLIHK